VSPKKLNQSAENMTQRPLLELYSFLLNNSSNGIFVANPVGQVIETNSRFCELLGYSHSQALALSLIDLFPEGEPNRNLSALPSAPAETANPGMRRIRRSDGVDGQ
jgi:PAS domain S-box-containing protein